MQDLTLSITEELRRAMADTPGETGTTVPNGPTEVLPVAPRRPVIRFFVSSTFRDLEAERDCLLRDVFPVLGKLCRKYGADFQPIDLRWGVSGDVGREQKTLDVCLTEIRRCQETGLKPNFLILFATSTVGNPSRRQSRARSMT